MRHLIHFTGIFIIIGIFLIGCDAVVDSDNLEVATANKGRGNNNNSTIVPGHQTDDGSIPYGTVNGQYFSVYAWDDMNGWYWDLGDGRIQGNVDSIDDLDKNTITVCDYVVIYRGDFEGTPFLKNGWIRNNIKCSGYAYGKKAQTFNFLIVHETDPRYTEDLMPIWGNWGYLVYTIGGVGNIANPRHHVNN